VRRTLTNQWVVPYSPYMSLRYDCHINVEACISPKGSKYLYKYACKGGDRAMARVEGGAGEGGGAPGEVREINEINEFQDLRSIGASEACWRLFENPMGDRYPAVETLKVHLPDQQPVHFAEGREREALQHVNARTTTLTGFFAHNAEFHRCICEPPVHRRAMTVGITD
jgi:hypothetical protein